jgi:TetR/AcrR family transcriptional regulator, transcriptional repressor of aconitase
MPRPRFHSLPPERQRQILDVAARHFARDGFANASLNRILGEAGVSKGVAYYYFDDKGDLFATVVEEAWASLAADLWPDGFDAAALHGERLWPELERIYVRQVQSLAARPDTWRVVKATGEALTDPSAARLGPGLASFMAALEALVTQGQAHGQIRDDLPRELLVAVMRGLDDAIDRFLTDHPPALQADPALALRLFALLRQALSPPPPLAR